MNKDMITEDEFKDLTDSLETVGHYDPSVKDMLDHIQSSPVKWAGFSVEYATRLSELNVFKQEIEKVKALNIDRKSTRLNSSHIPLSRMPSSA